MRASYRSENGQQGATRVEAQSAANVQPANPAGAVRTAYFVFADSPAAGFAGCTFAALWASTRVATCWPFSLR